MKKKKTMFHKWIAAILVFCMCITPLTSESASVFAEEPTYQASITDSEHGQVSFQDSQEQIMEKKEGDTVSLSVSPEEGYQLQKLSVVSSDTNEELAGCEDAEADFTFAMPSTDVKINASFTETAAELEADAAEEPARTDSDGEVTIDTCALDSETKSHLSNWDESITIVDTVTYTNLIPGQEYTLLGILYENEYNPRPSTDSDGNYITSDVTFTPEKANGAVDVTLQCNGDSLDYNKQVVYEFLCMGDNPNPIARHNDFNDEDQSIYLFDCYSNLNSEGAETYGSFIEKASSNMNFHSRVGTYSSCPIDNLANMEFELRGCLYDAETKEPVLDDNGQEIRNTVPAVFNKHGEIRSEIPYQFSGLSTAGKNLKDKVELYCNGTLCATVYDDGYPPVCIPKITTKALDTETKDHASKADNEIIVKDTVYYENLFVAPPEPMSLDFDSDEGVVHGYLMDKDTGKPAIDGAGNPITGWASFVPENPSGSVEVTFVFDGTGMDPSTLVAYECLHKRNMEVGRALTEAEEPVDCDGLTNEGLFSVAEHTDLNDEEQAIHIPYMETSAIDSGTHSKLSRADSKVRVIDTVSYQNLLPGRNYRLEGKMMDTKTGKPAVDAEGTPITARADFTPTKADDTQDVVFSFDGSKLEGKSVTCYEELYQICGENLVKLMEHQDLKDKAQTILLPEMKTSAADKEDGDKTIQETPKAAIVDTVTFANLIPGKAYTVTGKIMEKETGKAVIKGETEITATAGFTAEKSEGTVNVTFEFDSTGLGDKELVVFEKILLNDKEVAGHEDLEDAEQTIKVSKSQTSPDAPNETPNKPSTVTPNKPTTETPNGPTTETPKDSITGKVQTGDNSLLAFSVLIGLGMAMCAVVLLQNKKKRG